MTALLSEARRLLVTSGVGASRRCVNPAHLEVVTHAENVRRGMVGSNTRAKTTCPEGHPYDRTRKSDGARLCSTCRRRQDRERWRRNHPGRPRRVTD